MSSVGFGAAHYGSRPGSCVFRLALELKSEIARFMSAHNKTAKPFAWMKPENRNR
jgi:hypothetical protein